MVTLILQTRKPRLQLENQEVPKLELDPGQSESEGGLSQRFSDLRIGGSCHASERTHPQAPLRSPQIHQVGEMCVYNKQSGPSGLTTCVPP